MKELIAKDKYFINVNFNDLTVFELLELADRYLGEKLVKYIREDVTGKQLKARGIIIDMLESIRGDK